MNFIVLSIYSSRWSREAPCACISCAALNADNPEAIADDLNGIGVIRRDGSVRYETREQVDAAYAIVHREVTRQFDDVLYLSPGIRVPPPLEVLAAEQTVEAEHLYVQLPVNHGTVPPKSSLNGE
jgi:hypothetical protein